MSHIPNIKHGGLRMRPSIIDEIHEAWARDRGYRSVKPEDLHAANTTSFKHQASRTTSHKRQAPSLSSKRQAPSHKRQAP